MFLLTPTVGTYLHRNLKENHETVYQVIYTKLINHLISFPDSSWVFVENTESYIWTSTGCQAQQGSQHGKDKLLEAVASKVPAKCTITNSKILQPSANE